MGSASKCVLKGLEDNPGAARLHKILMAKHARLVKMFKEKGNPNPVGAANKAIKKEAAIAKSNLNARIRQLEKSKGLLQRIEASTAVAKAKYDRLNATQRKLFREPTEARIGKDVLNQAWNRSGSLGEQALGRLEGIGSHKDIQSMQNPENAKDLYRMLRSDTPAEGGTAFVSKNPVVVKAAKVIREILDEQHVDITAAGAMVNYMQNYAPQVHTGKLLKKAGFPTWFKDISEGMDYGRIINPKSGMALVRGNPADEASFKRMAQYAFDEITDGKKPQKRDLNLGGSSGIPDLNMRRAHARFFQFADGDKFIEYNQKYGVGDEHLFNVMLSHIQRNGRDLGVMEVLGPRPRDFNAAFLSSIGARAGGRNTFNAMFRELMGDNGIVRDSVTAQVFEGTKNVLRSSLLGVASVSAFPDAALSVVGARMNGLTKAGPVRQMGRYMAALGSGAETRFGGVAGRMQLISNASNVADIAARNMGGSGRMAEGRGQGESFSDFASKAARFTMDKSGLSHMTLALERTSSYTAASDLGLYAKVGQDWDGLNDALKASLAKADIGPGDWATAMRAELLEAGGTAELLPVANIAAHDAGVGRKFADWDYMLRKHVSNVPDLAMSTATAGRFLNVEGGAGMGGHMVSSSALMFKTFPIQILRNFTLPLIQGMAAGESKAANMRMFSGTVLASAMLGYLSLGMKDKLKGREWPDLVTDDGVNGAVVRRSLWQAGTFGLAGDYMFEDQSGHGRKPVQNLLFGPLGNLADDVVFRTILGNLADMGAGEDTQVAKDLAHLGKQYTPWQIWQVKAVAQAAMWVDPELEKTADSVMQDWVDPNYKKNKKQREKKQKEKMGM
jgi:hypothetical protein